MTKHSSLNAADPSGIISALGSIDEFVAPVQISHSEDAPSVSGGPINMADQASDNTDHPAGIADFFAAADSINASGDNSHHFIVQDSPDSAIASGSGPLIDQGDVSDSSAVDSADLQGFSQTLVTASDATFGDSFHFSSIFAHIDNQNSVPADNVTSNLSDSTVGGASGAPSAASFSASEVQAVGIPDVVSAAGGHGGPGGSGGGGGTVPAPYTTNSGTGVDIHVTYDSSVGNAPAGFTSVVQQVADFFASSLQDSTAITINIDVGYGEVDGMRMGRGATGESVTNLQQVSYAQLTSAYSTTGLTLGTSVPSGNLYVSNAEAKALDITITSPQAVDGYVGFSSKTGIFDYNNADGVTSSQYDFYGAVAHEFSEVMGRILLVGGSINNAPSYMAYDFFHFTNAGVQDFSGNGGYFSNDQGATNLASFNNPSNGGDAGDWANSGTSNSGGSTYDAFNAFGTAGEVAPVTHTDLPALQAVGFQLHAALV